MPDNVGTANYATQFGIPSATVTWTGRSTTAHVGTVFNSWEVSAGGEITQTRDNTNEIQAQRMTNDTLQFSMMVKPVAANIAAALVIAGDLPKKNTILTGVGSDAQFATSGTILIDEARTTYAPDGEAVVNLTVTKHVGKTFSTLS